MIIDPCLEKAMEYLREHPEIIRGEIDRVLLKKLNLPHLNILGFVKSQPRDI